MSQRTGEQMKAYGNSLVLILFSVFTIHAYSEQIGPVYEVKEPSMLDEIYRVLNEKQASGELAKLQQQAIDRSKHSIENPKTVANIEKATQNRTFYWDPTITAPRTVLDPSGNTVVKEGTKVNPLDYVSMPENMLFFDGSDEKQVKKMESLYAHYKGQLKSIMVKGKPLDLSRRYNRQIYFDQGGELVRKLGITKVPSLVSQQGKLLRIDEIAD